MAIVRWSPYRDMMSLQSNINRLFSDAFGRSSETEDDYAVGAWQPNVDIFETDEALVIHVELPGVKKEEVSLEVKDNALTIRGERKMDQAVREDRYYRRERVYGTFHRAFNLPATIAGDKIRARFRDGVLEIEIPKPEEKKPRQINIQAE